jgi:hypothetical protein
MKLCENGDKNERRRAKRKEEEEEGCICAEDGAKAD